MRCPFCDHAEDKVVDSREVSGGSSIRRRRECLGCHRRFTSYERVGTVPLRVVKKDGRREDFSRDKLLGGLLKACQKRAVATKDLDRVVDEIEALAQNSPDREIAATDIGNLVMERLKDLDQVAYVRFASVYRQFRDISEFLEEIKRLAEIHREGAT
jgi:transcriptional repressor NrdR